MHRSFVLRNNGSGGFGGYALMSLSALLLYTAVGASAQSAPPLIGAKTAPFSVRVTHLLGLPNTKNNCNGTLSIQDNALRFQQGGKPDAQVEIAAVQDFSLDEESKQVGGLPMKIGKVAAPYGGGRVVSLFAHKKYDSLTLKFVDSEGGVHDAIFQLTKEQAGLVRNELMARGVPSSSGGDQPTTQSTTEVRHDK